MSIASLNRHKENEDFAAFFCEFQKEKKRIMKRLNTESISLSELNYIIENTEKVSDIVQQLYTYNSKLDKSIIDSVVAEWLHDEISQATEAYKQIQSFPYIVHKKSQMPHFLAFQKDYLKGEEYPYFGYGKKIEGKVRHAKHKCLVVCGRLASGRRRFIYKELEKCFANGENERAEEIIDLTSDSALDKVLQDYINIIKGYHFRNKLFFLFKDIAFDESRKPILETIRDLKINTVCFFIEDQNFEDNRKKNQTILDAVFNSVPIIHLSGIESSQLAGESEPFKVAFNRMQENLQISPLPIYTIMLRDRYELSDFNEIDLKREYCLQLYEQYKDSEFHEQVLDIIFEFSSVQSLSTMYLQMMFDVIKNYESDDMKLKLILKKLEEQHDITEDSLLLDVKNYLYMKVMPAKEVFQKFHNDEGYYGDKVPLSTDLLQYVYLNFAIDLIPELNDKEIREVNNIFTNLNVTNRLVFLKYIEFYRLYFLLSKYGTVNEKVAVQNHLKELNKVLKDPIDEEDIWIAFN